MMKIRLLAFAAIAITIAGCTFVHYPEPEAGVPTATLTFFKGLQESDYRDSSAQDYKISENRQCTDLHSAAILGQGMPDSEDAHVAAGHRIVLLASTTIFHPKIIDGQDYLQSGICESSASFIVEAGHTYRVKHTGAIFRSCAIEVIDAATNAPPASLKQSRQKDCSPQIAD
jgi:hypothetical protein